MATWQEEYKKKVISVDEALAKVKDNDHIITGLGCGESRVFFRNLHKIADKVRNVTVTNCLPVENYEFFMNPEYNKNILSNTWFYSAGQRKIHPTGRVHFVPQHLHLALSKRMAHVHCNIFVGVATPPDKHGNMSLSLSVTYEKELLRQADLVILEVNDQYPRTFGDTFITVKDVDYIIEASEQPAQVPSAIPDEKDKAIGKYIAELIEDGSTIQLGIGGMPSALAKELVNKKDLGVHTEMFVDGMIDLIEAGALTGRKKTLYPDKIVCTFAMGTQRVYDFLDDNP
ncbi:MAG: 4-hydroxybutyrate--acetyl-CoA CoA transferase, partial [Peptococcia bacterium]